MGEQSKSALSSEVLQGYGVGTRGARGKVVRVQRHADEPAAEGVGIAAGDSQCLGEALGRVVASLSEDALATTPEVAGILEAQAVMAADPTLVAQIWEHLGRQDGTQVTASELLESFSGVAQKLRRVGGYIGERADDIVEIGRRVVEELYQTVPSVEAFPEGSILLFQELSAADASKLDSTRLAGVIVESGGPTGHVALILGALDIPAIVGCRGAANLAEGTEVALEPARGVLLVGPYAGEPSSLTDTQVRPKTSRSVISGGGVHLMANVGTLADAVLAADLGANGIGLVRTEFLFGDGSQEPSKEAQVEIYRGIVGPFEGSGSPVTFRTLDVGSDKPLTFLGLDREENPALGVRGFRIVKSAPNVIETQLEALAVTQKATKGLAFRVMAPMIATLEEVRSFVTLGRSSGLEALGVMIEVPALALGFASVVNDVDFASLGTNDLLQYLMGADRNGPTLGDLLDPWNPVVLRLIASVAREALRSGIPLSVCGEAASDPALAVVLVGVGVTGLSMAPRSLSPVKKLLGSVSRSFAASCARSALRERDAISARKAVQTALFG